MQKGAQHLSPRGDEYTDEPKNMVSMILHSLFPSQILVKNLSLLHH